MTLYDALAKANRKITPDSNLFFFYVLKTSDNNGGFLRTCYCEKQHALKDRDIEDIGFIVVGSQQPITENKLLDCFTHKGIRTDLKLQIYYGLITSAEEGIELNKNIGYKYNIVVNFNEGD